MKQVDWMKRRSSLLGASALATALLVVWNADAWAQAGSAGGSIGKQGKSVSGGESAPEPRRAPHKPMTTRQSRPSAASAEPKPRATPSLCAQVTGATWSSWAAGMFGSGDTTFAGGGRAVHRSGITGNWSCSGGKMLLQWPGETMRPMTMSADGKTLLGEDGQTRFTRKD
jgi:hypothetical protein